MTTTTVEPESTISKRDDQQRSLNTLSKLIEVLQFGLQHASGLSVSERIHLVVVPEGPPEAYEFVTPDELVSKLIELRQRVLDYRTSLDLFVFFGCRCNLLTGSHWSVQIQNETYALPDVPELQQNRPSRAWVPRLVDTPEKGDKHVDQHQQSDVLEVAAATGGADFANDATKVVSGYVVIGTDVEDRDNDAV